MKPHAIKVYAVTTTMTTSNRKDHMQGKTQSEINEDTTVWAPDGHVLSTKRWDILL